MAFAIDDLTLLVHDIVILQYMFTDIEVTRLDLLLRMLDGTRDKLVFNWVVLFHTELVHDRRDII